MTNTLVPRTHTHTLLFGVFYSSTQFIPWNTLLLGILCSSTHSSPWHILFLSTLCFLEQFAAWNSLLPGTLEKLYQVLKQSVPGRKLLQEAKCYKKQSVCQPMKCRFKLPCWVWKWTGSFGPCVMPAGLVCQSLLRRQILELTLEQLWSWLLVKSSYQKWHIKLSLNTY